MPKTWMYLSRSQTHRLIRHVGHISRYQRRERQRQGHRQGGTRQTADLAISRTFFRFPLATERRKYGGRGFIPRCAPAAAAAPPSLVFHPLGKNKGTNAAAYNRRNIFDARSRARRIDREIKENSADDGDRCCGTEEQSAENEERRKGERRKSEEKRRNRDERKRDGKRK